MVDGVTAAYGSGFGGFLQKLIEWVVKRFDYGSTRSYCIHPYGQCGISDMPSSNGSDMFNRGRRAMSHASYKRAGNNVFRGDRNVGQQSGCRTSESGVELGGRRVVWCLDVFKFTSAATGNQ